MKKGGRIPASPKPRKKVKKASVKTVGFKLPKSVAPKGGKVYKANKRTRKEIIDDNLKTKKIGSNARRVAYKEMGLKQDHTTTGYGSVKAPKKAGLKTPSASNPKSSKLKTVATKTKKQVRATVKAAKARSKGEAAIKAGKQRKALRMRKKYDRQTRRAK